MAVYVRDHHGTYYHEKELRKRETVREHQRRKRMPGVTVIPAGWALGHLSMPVAPLHPQALQCYKSLRLWEERNSDSHIDSWSITEGCCQFCSQVGGLNMLAKEMTASEKCGETLRWAYGHSSYFP